MGKQVMLSDEVTRILDSIKGKRSYSEVIKSLFPKDRPALMREILDLIALMEHYMDHPTLVKCHKALRTAYFKAMRADIGHMMLDEDPRWLLVKSLTDHLEETL